MSSWWDVVKPWTWPDHAVGGAEKVGGAVAGKIGEAGQNALDAVGGALGGLDRSGNEFREVDPSGDLRGQAQKAGAWADAWAREARKRGHSIDALAAQLGAQARGEQSYSAEALRQALQQNQASQQSMAAGARPGNAAMAARVAMRNNAQLGAALGGQQALAGIQEQKAAQDALGRLLAEARGQEMAASTAGRGQAIGGYGQYEGNRTSRFGAMLGVPTDMERAIAAGKGLLDMYQSS